MNYVVRKYWEFYDKHGYIPKKFYVYNCCDVKDIHPTLTTYCGRPDKIGCILMIVKKPIEK